MQGATLMFIDRHGDRNVIERGNQPAAPQASGTHNSRASLPRMPILHSTPRPLSPVHELKREVSIEQAEREAEEGVSRALGGLQIR